MWYYKFIGLTVNVVFKTLILKQDIFTASSSSVFHFSISVLLKKQKRRVRNTEQLKTVYVSSESFLLVLVWCGKSICLPIEPSFFDKMFVTGNSHNKMLCNFACLHFCIIIIIIFKWWLFTRTVHHRTFSIQLKNS